MVVVILWVGLDSNFSVRCSTVLGEEVCLQQELYVSNRLECGFMDVFLPYNRAVLALCHLANTPHLLRVTTSYQSELKFFHRPLFAPCKKVSEKRVPGITLCFYTKLYWSDVYTNPAVLARVMVINILLEQI